LALRSTHLFIWYQAYFSSVVELPKTHLLSAGKSSFVSNLFQTRDAPLFLKTLSYQENLLSLSLGSFYFNHVYVVYCRYPQNDRTQSVTRKKGTAALRKSSPTVSSNCAPCPGKKSAKKSKYCPNVRGDQKQLFFLHTV